MNPDENLRSNLLDALKLAPDNPPLLKQIADIEFHMCYYKEALEKYKKSIELGIDSNEAKLGLAKCYFALEKPSAAIVIAEELAKDDDAPTEVFMLLCKLLINEKQFSLARDHYNIAVSMDEKFIDESIEYKLRNKASEPKQIEEDWDAVPQKQVEDDFDEEDYLAQFEQPTTDFSHVGGLENVKEEISLKIIYPIKHPDLFEEYGQTAGGGILLYGPPGCGKTHIARAVAGEAEAAFLSVGIHEILDMWIGNSEKNLNEIFELARRQQPCVLFFDEVDALGASRADMKKSSTRHIVNQFLSEMDGVDSDNDGVLSLAATNAPWHLDSAFRRPGRFDKIIFVPPPDLKARIEILDILIKDKPCEELDLQQIAEKTEDFSGADLKSLITNVIEQCLRNSIRSGNKVLISQDLMLEGLKTVKPTTKEWFKIARNYALYANEGGLYDDILEYLKIKK